MRKYRGVCVCLRREGLDGERGWMLGTVKGLVLCWPNHSFSRTVDRDVLAGAGDEGDRDPLGEGAAHEGAVAVVTIIV